MRLPLNANYFLPVLSPPSCDSRFILLGILVFLSNVRIELKPDDEFLILGCDGIWDCLTNEQAFQCVRSRLDTKTLDEIVRVDPRYFRPAEVETLLGNPARAKLKLGWEPRITVEEIG